MAPMTRAEAAQRMSLTEEAIADVFDSPAGTVIVTQNGVSYIDIPKDCPDAEGKVGLAYLAKPNPDLHYSFPVYAQPGEEAEASADVETPAADNDGSVPKGKAQEVLDWVGDDKERATAALAAEEATGKPRRTLVVALAAVLEAEASADVETPAADNDGQE